jgi:DNA polymerase III sliding clamp (beta) subunit (PCNA family)
VFLDVKLGIEFFESFECNENETVYVNLPTLLPALKNGSAKDYVVIKTTDDSVHLEIVSDSKTMIYELKQIEVDEESVRVPEIDEDVTISLNPSFLKDWKNSVVDFTKASVTLKPLKDSLVIESSESTCGSVKLVQTIPSDGINYISFNDPEPVTIGTKNISKAFQIGKVSDNINFGYKTSMPIRLGANLGDGGTLQLYMAPCLGEDMED